MRATHGETMRRTLDVAELERQWVNGNCEDVIRKIRKAPKVEAMAVSVRLYNYLRSPDEYQATRFILRLESDLESKHD